MYFIASRLAAAINRTLHDELVRFAGRRIALHIGGWRGVWRIDERGQLAAVSPLTDADCRIKWKDGAVRLSGDGELFSRLSAVWQRCDWPGLLSGMAGSRLAPLVLYRLERARAGGHALAARYLASPAAAAEYGSEIEDLKNRVTQVGKRVEHLLLPGKEH